jgi:hypothetical protein
LVSGIPPCTPNEIPRASEEIVSSLSFEQAANIPATAKMVKKLVVFILGLKLKGCC